jgi:hypothetical protein
MNGKRAKLMRKVGRGLTKKDKKMYNTLSHDQRGTLNALYKHLIETRKI